VFRKRWEVYRVIPKTWPVQMQGTAQTYYRCWRYKTACRIAADADHELRAGRSDEEFAAFRVRRVR
jgi:hypothetical protein